MSRPLRIEFPAAVFHVTARGDRREGIFADDEDRGALLAIVEHGLDRFDAQMLAYCLMGNHYDFVLHTRSANLSLRLNSQGTSLPSMETATAAGPCRPGS